MASDLWLADSNILIRWVQPADANYPLVRSAIVKLKQIGAIPCYVSQNIGEFWNALTRPLSHNGYGLSPMDADIRASAVESHFHLLPETSTVHTAWRRLLVDHSISGVQVHDARLVASMRVHGVSRILTFNAKDFARYPGIEAIHPARLAGT
jgi:predicted nucleic acid-binding protein